MSLQDSTVSPYRNNLENGKNVMLVGIIQVVLTVALWLFKVGHSTTNGASCLRLNTPAIARGSVALGGEEVSVGVTLRDVLPYSERSITTLHDPLTHRRHLYGCHAIVTTPIGTAHLVIGTTIVGWIAVLVTRTDSVGADVRTGQHWRMTVNIDSSHTLLATVRAGGTTECHVTARGRLTLPVLVAFWLAGGPLGNCLVSRRTENMCCTCMRNDVHVQHIRNLY